MQSLESGSKRLEGTGVVEATVAALVEYTGSGNWSAWLPAYDALGVLKTSVTESQSIDLSSRLASVIETNDERGTREVLRRLTVATDFGPLGTIGAKAIWRRMAKWAQIRPGSSVVREVLSWLAVNASLAESQEADDFAADLERSAQAVVSADRDVTASTLAQLPSTPDQRMHRVDAILTWPRLEVGTTRHSIWRSAIRAAGPDRRQRPVKAVLSELEKAQGDDAAVANDLIANYPEIASASA
jgi:hypothetical protein